MRVRITLFTKILAWFLLNLILLGTLFLLAFGIRFRFEPWSPLAGGAASRVDTVTRLLASEIDEKDRPDRDAIVARYNEAYNVDFYVFDNAGRQLAGPAIELPAKVRDDITRPEAFGPPARNANNQNAREPHQVAPPGPPAAVSITTDDPRSYWVIVRALTFERGVDMPVRSRFIVRSDSYTGHGLFFDPLPWIAVGGLVVILSILLWIPFVRHITRSIGQMTSAAKRIADEDFTVRVDERRTDELGVLGSSINHLAERLGGFVTGQKRFLGDISHELNSPLARMQFAISILEAKARPEDKRHVEDVREDVEEMTRLVNDLLNYSKVGLRGTEAQLDRIELKEVVETAAARETSAMSRFISIAIEKEIVVLAKRELIDRAIANLVRNSIKYTDALSGRINITAGLDGSRVRMTIEDNGPGVPPDMLSKIFDPLFRVDSHRSRQDGGTGLGLAIVRSSVEACGGRVSARLAETGGLAVDIELNAG